MRDPKKRRGEFSGRNTEATPLKNAMDQMFSEYQLKKKFSEMKLISAWEKIMGKPIATRTSKIYIKDRILFVKLSSAPLKNELNMSKKKIIELLEKEGGKDIITDIRFL